MNSEEEGAFGVGEQLALIRKEVGMKAVRHPFLRLLVLCACEAGLGLVWQ